MRSIRQDRHFIYLARSDGLGLLARIVAVLCLELLDERNVAGLGAGCRGAGVDLLLPCLVFGLALWFFGHRLACMFWGFL